MSEVVLFNEDCLCALDRFALEGIKFDAIITSPPYNMNLRVRGGKYVSRCGNKNHKEEFSTKYVNYTDDLPLQDYYEFQKAFLTKSLLVSDLVFYNIQMVTGNKPVLFKLVGELSEYLKEVIIWDKVNAQPAMATDMLSSQFEFIFVFDRNKACNRQFDFTTFDRGTESNVWAVKKERNLHIKAGFPSALIEKIVTLFVREGGSVLDPYMGSGTTGIVCKRLGRDFTGVELDEDMFNVAKGRIG